MQLNCPLLTPKVETHDHCRISAGVAKEERGGTEIACRAPRKGDTASLSFVLALIALASTTGNHAFPNKHVNSCMDRHQHSVFTTQILVFTQNL
jgi:hypothetical protein